MHTVAFQASSTSSEVTSHEVPSKLRNLHNPIRTTATAISYLFTMRSINVQQQARSHNIGLPVMELVYSASVLIAMEQRQRSLLSPTA